MTESKARVYTKRAWIVWLVAIVVVAAAVYVPSLHGKFLRDDNELIIKNPVAQSLAIPRAFSTYFLYGFDKTSTLYYRPLVTVSFQINNAVSYHDPISCKLTNLLLNALMAVAVFLLAQTLTKRVAIAGATALAFVVLPCHAESVAWVSGRTDIMAGLFMLAGFGAFVANYRRRPAFDWRLAALASVMFACALFSKEIGIVLPVLIGAYVLTLGDGMKREELVKWLPAVVIPLVLYFVCRKLALGAFGDGGDMGYLLKQRLSRIGFMYATYLRMLFVPREARPVYDSLRTDHIAPALKVLAWLVPAGLVTVAVWARKRAPVPAFGAAWIFVTLLPVVDIVPVHGLLIAERFAYLPSIGSSLIIGWFFSRLIAIRPAALKTLPLVIGALGVGFVMYCGALTVTGSQAYASNLDWSDWVRANKPKSKMIRLSASMYYQRAGQRKEAAEELEAAVDLDRDRLPKARTADWKYKVGRVYMECQDAKEAARAFADGVGLDPTRRDMWLELAKADAALGLDRDAVEAYRHADALGALGAADRAGMERAIRSGVR